MSTATPRRRIASSIGISEISISKQGPQIETLKLDLLLSKNPQRQIDVTDGIRRDDRHRRAPDGTLKIAAVQLAAGVVAQIAGDPFFERGVALAFFEIVLCQRLKRIAAPRLVNQRFGKLNIIKRALDVDAGFRQETEIIAQISADLRHVGISELGLEPTEHLGLVEIAAALMGNRIVGAESGFGANADTTDKSAAVIARPAVLQVRVVGLTVDRNHALTAERRE